jgi:Ca-activated chloride channel family protein
MTQWLGPLLLVTATLTQAGAAQTGQVWVNLLEPADGQEVIGEVELVADALAELPIKEVVFFVDGRPVGSLTAAPFRLRVDLGLENRPHVIEVLATDTEGRQGRHRVETAAVPLGSRYDVDLKQLYVTVTRDGERVRDLVRGDFTVLDDGRPQRLITFENGDVPFTAVLLIDASASMFGAKLEAARTGAASFIQGMRELDEGKVTVFSDVIQNTTPFSGNPEVLTAGLTGALGQGGTAVNDNLYAAIKLLESRQGRRLVVLLSDGIDSHSALDGTEVLDAARRSQAMVFWIRLLEADEGADDDQPRMASAWRMPDDYRRQATALRELVDLSGGRIIPVHSTTEIEPVFVEILRELREQYALGYYPDVHRRDGSWHRLKVRVDRPGAEARTHRGYLDD